MDATYINMKGVWKYLYRADDKSVHTIDFVLTAKRYKAAAKRFLDQAIDQSGEPELVTMDKSSVNKASMVEINPRQRPFDESSSNKIPQQYHGARSWRGETYYSTDADF